MVVVMFREMVFIENNSKNSIIYKLGRNDIKEMFEDLIILVLRYFCCIF